MQYPLSPRKFWKKVIGKIVFSVCVWLVLMAVTLFPVFLGIPTDAVLTLMGAYTLGITVIIFGGLILYMWYVRAYISRYFYDASENFVTIKKGVFAPAEIHVQYAKIQDVYVDQDILDRIMGLYDVHIASATAASAMEAHIDGVDHAAAEGLKNLLLQKIQGGNTTNASATIPSPTQTPIAPATLTEKVSSREYPLAPAWLTQSIVASLFSSLFFSVLITFYVAVPGKDSSESFTSVLGISPFVVWFLLYIVSFAFHIGYALIWRSVFYFEFMPDYILMRTGIISRNETHLPYRAVQDVNVTQGIVERLFGLATVSIENAAAAQIVGKTLKKSGITIPGQSLEKANHIAEVVRNVILTKNSTQTGI